MTAINDSNYSPPAKEHAATCTAITRQQREALQGHQAKVIWMTGLSGSGKSTTAAALEIKLHNAGLRTFILDGDQVRSGLNQDLGFDAKSRTENIRRIAEVARMMMDAGLIVIVTAISPFRLDREKAKERIGAENFIEVHISTPLHVCAQRDPKGLYQKSKAGQLANMTGVSSPYEIPEHPDLIIDTSTSSVVSSSEKILRFLGI